MSRASFAVLAVLLLLPACAPQTVDEYVAAARKSFGESMAPYQDHPAAKMVADLGPPDKESATPEGGRKLVWERRDTKTAEKTLEDGETKEKEAIDVQCTVTALTKSDDIVYFVFAGGNSVYCSTAFPKDHASSTPS